VQFQVSFEKLDQCKLWLTVWHSNSKSAWIKTIKNIFIRSKKVCLGEVTIPLNFNKVLKIQKGLKESETTC